MKLQPSVAVLLALLPAACGSPATQFYELMPVGPATAAAGGTACLPGPLTVQHVTLPATLDRSSIVRAAGPDRLDISGEHRWAAPLDGMVQSVLAEDLRTRLPGASVALPGDPAPKGSVGLAVTIWRFLPDAGGRTALMADWTTNAGAGAGPVHSETVAADGPPGVAQAATGMSRALGGLADRIAAVLSACR